MMIGAGVVVLTLEALGMLFLGCVAVLLIGKTRSKLKEWQGKG
jgi:hypothetical protein